VIKRIGSALHYTRLGNLVVRLYELPPLYVNVYTYSYKRVGVLYDVIGKTSSPYGLVKPIERDESILGTYLYVRQSDLKRKK